jgi:hypothetical protein
MSFLGLVPSESSTGTKRRQGSITKSGSDHAPRLLVEAAWHYRRTPNVGRELRRRQEGQPQAVCALAWQAQRRLHRARRAVIALDLVEEADEGTALVRREVGARLGGVQQVVDQEVRDEPVACPAPPGQASTIRPASIASERGSPARLAENAGGLRRGAQAVDQVGHRRDRVVGQAWEALGEEALRRPRRVRERSRAPRLVGEQRRDLEDRRRELGRERAGEVRERARRLSRDGQRARVALVPAERRGERVGVRVEEEAAVPRADEVRPERMMAAFENFGLPERLRQS